jgi:hypothetical protein
MSDQLFPNVLTVGADGSIGADLTGHVHAKGLDIDVAPGGVRGPQNLVRWLQASDGAVVADIGASESAPPALGRTNSMRTLDTSGAAAAVLALGTSDAGFASIAATTRAESRTIVDEGGTSSFVQLGLPNAGAKWRLWGPYTVNSPSLAPGAYGLNVALAHGLNLPNVFPIVAQREGTWGMDITWDFSRVDNNTLNFHFRNDNGGHNPALVTLELFLLTTS